MNNAEFEEFFTTMKVEEMDTLVNKGKEYSVGNDDRFWNFKEVAQDLPNTKASEVCYIYLKKHLCSIASYIKHGREFSDEPIRGRIVDARNYLAILAGIIHEENRQSQELPI